MITIKTGSYSKQEIKVLATLFSQLSKFLLDTYCPDNGKCTICNYRHICEAIHNASDFITDRVNY